jgi:hypothetical protein
MCRLPPAIAVMCSKWLATPTYSNLMVDWQEITFEYAIAIM